MVPRVWCECQLPLHRGAGHLVTKRQKRRHQEACRMTHVPFSREERPTAPEVMLRGDSPPTRVALADADSSSDNDDYIIDPDEDDRPDVLDWVDESGIDVTAGSEECDMQELDMFDAFKSTPRDQLKRMRNVLRTYYDVDIGNPTQTGHRMLNEVVGDLIQPQVFDCCSDGCVAYTGRLLAAASCPVCEKGRYHEDGRTKYTFQYIPLIPRLRLQFNHPARSAQLSSYRATFDPSQPDDGTRDDIFHGCWFRELWVEGRFQDHRELAIRLTLDAIGTVKNPKKCQSITPVVIYILNLPPATRDDASNALLTHVIPGGFDKEHADTWLQPLMDELDQLREGVDGYDGSRQEHFQITAHLILVTGDGPAIADVMGTKKPGKAKQSCRMCTFRGTIGRGGKYFYPHDGNLVTRVNVDLRAQMDTVERRRGDGTTARDFEKLKMDMGINYRPTLVDIPTLHFPRSFPFDTMHSMNHNIPKSLFHLWKGSKYQQKGHTAEKFPWVIPNPDWLLIDRSMTVSRATVPTCVGTAPRTTGSFANWTTHEWRSFFMTYGTPAMCYYLPRAYALNLLRYRQLLRYTSQRHFTSADITAVQTRVEDFIHEYEDLYYSGRADLLPSCTIQFHYLLHLSQNIRDFGPPSCYAQWSLEQFLRTVKGFSTSKLYRHRSAEINALIREWRIHAVWSSTAAEGRHAGLSEHDDDNAAIVSHGLVSRLRVCMPREWQRELSKVYNPTAPWHTGTAPRHMVMYRNLILPTGLKVGMLASNMNNLVSRCNAFVMYYDDVPANPSTVVRPLSFGTVVTLFSDPADLSAWAGIVRYRNLRRQPFDIPHPLRFEQDDNDMRWVSVDRIVDLIGVAQVYYRKRHMVEKAFYIVDKHGFSEE